MTGPKRIGLTGWDSLRTAADECRQVLAGQRRPVAVSFFNALQRGQVDRRTLAPDYTAFLTPALVRRASRTLAPLGE